MPNSVPGGYLSCRKKTWNYSGAVAIDLNSSLDKVCGRALGLKTGLGFYKYAEEKVEKMMLMVVADTGVLDTDTHIGKDLKKLLLKYRSD